MSSLLNSGKVASLRTLVNHTTPQNLVLRLFTNDVTPELADLSSKYEEPTFIGYRAIELSGFAWKIANAEPFEARYSEQSFISHIDQSTQNVFGYYITQGMNGPLVHAQRFKDAPNPITNMNDQIKITPRIVAMNVAGD